MHVYNFEGFPVNSALLGLVIHHDPLFEFRIVFCTICKIHDNSNACMTHDHERVSSGA